MCVFFFFKQKTAYEMRISDWSSDVCSSDLRLGTRASSPRRGRRGERRLLVPPSRPAAQPRASGSGMGGDRHSTARRVSGGSGSVSAVAPSPTGRLTGRFAEAGEAEDGEQGPRSGGGDRESVVEGQSVPGRVESG